MTNTIKRTTLFAVVLACVLAVAFSFSAVRNTSYAQANEIQINGVTYNSTINQKGPGWNWNASTKMLVLNNFKSEGTGHPIWIKCANEGDTITIYCVGKNSITTPSGDGSIRLGDVSTQAVRAKYVITGDPDASLGITNSRKGQGNYTVGYWLTGSGSEVEFKDIEFWTHIEGSYCPSVVFSENGQVIVSGGRFNASVDCDNATETAMVFRGQACVSLKAFDFMWIQASNSKDSSKAKLYDSSLAVSGSGSDIKTADGAMTTSSKMFRGTKLASLTRIFGQSRYDTALKVAKAYSESKGRYAPGAIVVASGDNYPDALGGGYLAVKKGGPLVLVTKSTEAQILKHIEDEGYTSVYILGGLGAVSAGFEAKCRAIDEDMSVKRLAGQNRYETNIAILKEAGVNKSTNYDEILLCNGQGFADSLSASGTGKPILLVDGKTLTKEQKDMIGASGTRSFYVVGGTGVMSNYYKEYIESNYSDCTCDRLAGPSRYETSVAVAEQFSSSTCNNVVLAYAQNFPDGLSGGPLAVSYGAPLILVDSNNTAAAKTFTKKHHSQRMIVLGGPSLISDAAAQSLRAS